LRYRKRNIQTGKIAEITQDEHDSANLARHHGLSDKQLPNQSKAPKPTEDELNNFTKFDSVELFTNSDNKFNVIVRGNRELISHTCETCGISPSYLIKSVLGTFVDSFPPDRVMFVCEGDKNESCFSVAAEGDDSYLQRKFVFYKDEKKIEVYHNQFELDDKRQNTGLSKKIMKESLDLYESLGVSKVYLYATFDVGSYVWAKYGFVPKDLIRCKMLADELTLRLNEHPKEFPPDSVIHNELSEYIKHLSGYTDKAGKQIPPEPKAIRLIADYDKPIRDSSGNTARDKFRNPKKAGKELLLKSGGWSGVADLTDKSTVDRWKQYSNTRIKGVIHDKETRESSSI